jgi:hypothetical protein
MLENVLVNTNEKQEYTKIRAFLFDFSTARCYNSSNLIYAE